MRWQGQTIEEKRRIERAPYEWHRVYAWRPVKTVEGVWVWLEPVDRISWVSNCIPSHAWHTFHGGWSFRLPREETP